MKRAYINVTGNISHLIAFRVTPDIARETGTGSSLNGSYTYRLKYAYGQFNFDDWMTRGSWARFGVQQTPWVDFMETLWRYRFQGTIFEDREGYLSSSDFGATFHYNFGKNYGDVHTGFYNGDNYNRVEPNDQKAFMTRATLRPLPQGPPAIRGLRITGFYDNDAYVKNGERDRGIVAVTFEHLYVNGSFDYLWATDQMRAASPKLDSEGYSVWVTPRTTKGWEGILRFDHLEREQTTATAKGKTRPHDRRRLLLVPASGHGVDGAALRLRAGGLQGLQPGPPERAAVGPSHAGQFLATDHTDYTVHREDCHDIQNANDGGARRRRGRRRDAHGSDGANQRRRRHVPVSDLLEVVLRVQQAATRTSRSTTSRSARAAASAR